MYGVDIKVRVRLKSHLAYKKRVPGLNLAPDERQAYTHVKFVGANEFCVNSEYYRGRGGGGVASHPCRQLTKALFFSPPSCFHGHKCPFWNNKAQGKC